jgi:hypothetical protein
MRHTKASPYCVVPAGENPAACIAASAVAGRPGAQPRDIGRWKYVKSTSTVTPEADVHVAPPAAPARAAGVTIAMIAIVTPRSAVCSERARTFTS